MDWTIVLPVVVTVFLAFTGYIITYFNNLRLAQRKDRLERVNRQLKELYGPLYALVRTSTRAWDEFRAVYRPRRPFWGTDFPPTPEEAAAWRLWMREVFLPLNLEMERIIVNNSDLLDEPTIPQCLLVLCAHVSGYKPIIKKWDSGDFSEHLFHPPLPTR